MSLVVVAVEADYVARLVAHLHGRDVALMYWWMEGVARVRFDSVRWASMMVACFSIDEFC